jgi:formate dehydrogenase alpha subunit
LIRKDGELLNTSWEEALDVVAERLTSIRKKNGPRSVALMGSSKCTVEENYLFQKMARVVLGTNNVDNGDYLAGRSLLNALDERLDGGGRVRPLSGLEGAEVIFVVGADPTESVPVVGYTLKRASRMKGIPIMVADPRRTDLVPFSSLWLPLAPHSDHELIHALAAILCKKEAYDVDFISRFTQGFDHYQKGLASLDLERVSLVTGLDENMMERAADLLKGKKIAFVVGQGVLQQRYGNLTLDALVNLALMTGSLGGEGKGFWFLAMENNQTGAWDMGTVPDLLPGRRPINEDLNRKNWEEIWGVRLSPDPGLNMIRMIEEAEKGNLKALYIMGENPLRTLPQPERVRKALDNLKFLVVQDILSNETTHVADVVLPGAAFSEKGGAFTNLEGRIQSFEPVVPPPGEAKPDWEILDLLGGRMGHPQRYSSIQDVRTEISRHVPMYSELRETKRQSWVKESSRLRPFRPDGEGKKISFASVVSAEDEERHEDYPFKALLGSVRFHLGSGTRTAHSDRIKDFALKGEAEISFEDADRMELKGGDTVKISSPYGSISREVILKKDLRPGLIFIPMGFHNNDVMQLIGLRELGVEGSPGLKEVGVRIEKIEP